MGSGVIRIRRYGATVEIDCLGRGPGGGPQDREVEQRRREVRVDAQGQPVVVLSGADPVRCLVDDTEVVIGVLILRIMSEDVAVILGRLVEATRGVSLETLIQGVRCLLSLRLVLKAGGA